MTTPLRGVVPPVVTPLTEAGDIDVPALKGLVDYLIEAGCHGLFSLGSTSEVPYFTDAERDTVLRATVEAANGRVPVIAGVMDMTTKRVIEQARRAKELGADGIVVTVPFYALSDESEIADHFRAVKAAVDLPIYAYDVPVRLNRVKLSVGLLIALAKEGVIAGVKDSSGDDVSFRRLVMANRDAGSPLSLLTGHELVVDGCLLMGADGVVPGYGNVDPHGYVALYDAAQRGDWEAVRAEQDRLARGFEIVFAPRGRSGDVTGVGAFKTAMMTRGIIPNNVMAFPNRPLSEEDAARVADIVKANGLVD